MKQFLKVLRAANVERQKLWTDGQSVPNEFRALETVGEAGEVANVVKKFIREASGWRGSRATVTDLEDELADVVICLDLLSEALGEELAALVQPDNPIVGVPPLNMAIRLCDATGALGVLVLDGFKTSGRAWPFVHALNYTRAIAAHFDIDLEAAVARKFNVTSENVDLPVRIDWRDFAETSTTRDHPGSRWPAEDEDSD